MSNEGALGALSPEGYRISHFSLIASTIAINILSLALPITTLQVYDRILPSQSTDTLVVLGIGIAVVVGLEVVLRLTRAYLVGFFGAAYVHKLSCNAMEHILAADLAGVGPQGSRVSFQSLAAVRGLKDFHSGHSLTILVELALVPVFLVLIAYIGGLLVLAPLTLLCAFVVLTLLNGFILKYTLGEREIHDDARYQFLIQNLNAVHAVKAFAQEQYLLRRYESLQEKSCISNFSVSRAMTASFNASTIFSHLMTAATVGLGALAVIRGELTVGSLIAVVLLSGRVMQPLQRGLMLWARYQDRQVAKLKVTQVFKTPAILHEPREEFPTPASSLEIQDLSFSYDDGAPLLDGLHLSLKRGDVISITGAQGSGKTTLLKLIAGLHRPKSGSVLVDGLRATDFPPHRLNEHIGYMATEGTIFRGTIRDNITRFGDVPLAQSMFIAELLGVDQEIAMLPAGLDTKLEGTGSDSIPPGLKQRLAIVRVLATKPRILLFDNADRSLDTQGYSMVHRLLARLKHKTSMIIVSDDENLRRIADKHYELVDATLQELTPSPTGLSQSRAYRSVRL